MFYDRDIHLEWYAQVESFVRAVAAGSWPVWNNSIGFGQPLLADPSAQVLYPPTWLNLVVLPWTYYTVFVLFHLLLASLGLYSFGREIGLRGESSLVAAAAFLYGGPLVSLVNVWHHFAGAAYIPWVLLCARRTARTGRPREALFLGAALSGQVLAGSADMCAMSLLMVAGLFLVQVNWQRPRDPRHLRALFVGAAAVLLAAGLTAASWMPALEVVRRSPRAALPEAMRTLWSVSPLGALQTVFPVFVRDLTLPAAVQATLHDGAQPFLASLYLGIPVVGLVAAASAAGRPRLFFGLLALGGGAFLVALGRHAPFYSVAMALLPPFQTFRYPMKAMIIVALAAALLAGLGFEALRAGRPWARTRAMGLAGLLGFVALALGLSLWIEPNRAARALLGAAPIPAEGMRAIGLAVGTAGLGGLLCAGLWLTGSSRAMVASVCVLVAELYTAHLGLIPTTPRELVAFKPPAIRALGPPDGQRLYVYEYFLTPGSARRYLGRADPYPLGAVTSGVSLHRAQVLAQRLYPFPPVAGRWGFEGSYDVDTRGLYPFAISALVGRLQQVEGSPAHLRLLRLGAVSHVIALHTQGFEDLELISTLPSLFPEPIRVLRVPEPLPRAYAVTGVRVARGAEATAEIERPDFDLQSEVVLTDGLARPGSGPAGPVRIVDLRPDRMRLEALVRAPGHVVLVDAYDPGWRATVDGQPATVLPANGGFRAVPVGAGKHVIELRYRPSGLLVGLGISAGTALGLALFVVGGTLSKNGRSCALDASGPRVAD